MHMHRRVSRSSHVVRWQNAVGSYLGQSGEAEFATLVDAKRFEAYAAGGGNNPSSLRNESIISAGLKLPLRHTIKDPHESNYLPDQ